MVRSGFPPMDTRPSFFKIVFPEKLIDLTIPPEIIKQMNLGPSGTITAKLRGPCGDSNIKLLRKKNGKIHFEEKGWEIFLKQHSIRKFEFLVFRHNGNTSFDVNVFGVNGCLKSYGSGEATNKTRKKQKASPASSSAPSFEATIKGSSIGCVLVIPKRFQDKYLGGCNRMEMILRNAKGVSWSVGIIPFCTKYACFSKGWKAFAEGNNLEEGDLCIFKLVEENVMEVHVSCRCVVSDDDVRSE